MINLRKIGRATMLIVLALMTNGGVTGLPRSKKARDSGKDR